jgi:hypothetical protein
MIVTMMPSVVFPEQARQTHFISKLREITVVQTISFFTAVTFSAHSRFDATGGIFDSQSIQAALI